MHSGNPIDAWVLYDATTKILNLSWGHRGDNTSEGNKSISYQVDLRKVLPEWATIGFSATTGSYTERHVKHRSYPKNLKKGETNRQNRLRNPSASLHGSHSLDVIRDNFCWLREPTDSVDGRDLIALYKHNHMRGDVWESAVSEARYVKHRSDLKNLKKGETNRQNRLRNPSASLHGSHSLVVIRDN
ncbi:Concanavalin A-like lectin/glucanase superfamily [Artemisia annua]|uniref:Concanavalin A-like lectin/glucanase superfamily n=1 Tax=Artemisia annua TaxID=35608 RepID=A0A2U1M315_ARTAN|nr:Concanavalin A-like lectin/glucanase superfamily [Artemisia annua]